MDIPKDFLSKDLLSQFKTEEDVSNFLTSLHARVLEQMLAGEMDAHLGYEKHSASGIHSGNSRNGSYEKKSRPNTVNLSSKFPVTVRASLNR